MRTLDQIRSDTPGIRQVAHFNNAGASLPPSTVITAVTTYFQQECLTGGYETAARNADVLHQVYSSLAELLNCQPTEVALVSSATSAWQQVFYGIPFKAGDCILTSVAEYGSNYLAYLQVARRYGVLVEVIPETSDGDFDILALEAILQAPSLQHSGTSPTQPGDRHAAVQAASSNSNIRAIDGPVSRKHTKHSDLCTSVSDANQPHTVSSQEQMYDSTESPLLSYARGKQAAASIPSGSVYGPQTSDPSSACGPVKLVSISHIPTSSGRVYDAAAVGKVAAKYGVPFLLDACQSVGQMPIDVQQLQCTFLAGTSRKYLRGPRGAGFLYASRTAVQLGWEPACIDVVGAQWQPGGNYELSPGACRYEQYEMSFSAKVGLGAAVQYCLDVGLDWIWNRIQQLAKLLRQRLGELPGVYVHDKGALLCGIVSFTKKGNTAEDVRVHLSKQNVNVSVSRIHSTRNDFEARGLTEVVRASIHYYNIEQEIDNLVAALRQLPAVQAAG